MFHSLFLFKKYIFYLVNKPQSDSQDRSQDQPKDEKYFHPKVAVIIHNISNQEWDHGQA